MDRKAWIILAIGLVIIFALLINVRRYRRDNKSTPSQIEQPASQEQIVHIDGYDQATGEIISPVNVWSDYETRNLAFKLDHGTEVTMIGKTADGNGIKIRDEYGREGWITYFFIKELK